MARTRPEVWAIRRQTERVPLELHRDWPAFVAQEIRYWPVLFEVVYR